MYMSACCFFTHRAHHLKEGQGKARMACSRDLSSVGVVRALLKKPFCLRSTHTSRAIQQEALPHRSDAQGGGGAKGRRVFDFLSRPAFVRPKPMMHCATPARSRPTPRAHAPARIAKVHAKATPLFFFCTLYTEDRAARKRAVLCFFFYAVMVKLQNHSIY